MISLVRATGAAAATSTLLSLTGDSSEAVHPVHLLGAREVEGFPSHLVGVWRMVRPLGGEELLTVRPEGFVLHWGEDPVEPGPLVGLPGSSEGRPAELLGVQTQLADLRVVLALGQAASTPRVLRGELVTKPGLVVVVGGHLCPSLAPSTASSPVSGRHLRG